MSRDLPAVCLPRRSPLRPWGRVFVGALLLAACLAGQAGGAFAATVIDHADDLCAPGEDPCVVDAPVLLEQSAVLDFGGRRLEIRGKGSFDVGQNTLQIRCGSLVVDVGNDAAFVLRRSIEGQRAGGSLLVTARRSCDGGDVRCIDDAGCDLGACGSRRCSLRPTRACTSDANCDLGVCGANRRCSLSQDTRCFSDAHCDLGVCPVQRSCSQLNPSPTHPDGVVPCTADSQCFFGSCSVGTGAIDFEGSVAGEADDPGSFTLDAAGPLSAAGGFDMDSTGGDGGGRISLRSRDGGVFLDGALGASGRFGGSVDVEAAGEVVFAADADVRGGRWGAGDVFVDAKGDIVVTGRILASGMAGGSLGGFVEMSAGGSITFDATDLPDAATMVALHGADSQSENDDYGDAGEMALFAAGGVSFLDTPRVSLRGGVPHGWGGGLAAYADGDVDFSGIVEATGGGPLTGGGFLELYSDHGSIVYGAASRADVTGGLRGGPGGVLVAAREQAVVLGQVRGDGNPRGEGSEPTGRVTDVSACEVLLGAGADLDTNAFGGKHLLQVGDRLVVEAGSSITAKSGLVELRSRSEAVDVELLGTIAPAPSFSIVPTIPTCGCGDGEPDAGEDCDPGPAGFSAGSACRVDCTKVACGRPTDSRGPHPTSADGLFALKASVGAVSCDLRVCDVDGNGRLGAPDALTLLRAATGRAWLPACPG